MTRERAFETVAFVAAALALLSAPSWLERGTLNDVWNVALAVVLASAWNLLGGFAGQVSLGYSAFVGIGAYTTVLLSLGGWPPALTLPAGAFLAAAFSVAIGLPTFRLRGPYFTIATIGVGEAVRVVASSVSFTGGASGLRMPAGSFDFESNFREMVLLAVAVVWIAARISRSAFGSALAAVKQDIDAAEALGVNSTRLKVMVHALSAAIVGLAGGLFAINFQYVSPGSVFDFRQSLTIVLMPIVGGVGTVAGPVLGAILFGWLQLKLLSVPALLDSSLFIYGSLLIAVMLFEPKGLLGLAKRLLARRPRKERAGA